MPGEPLGDALEGELAARRVARRRGGGAHPRVQGGAGEDAGGVARGVDEERVVLAQQALVGGRAVEHHRQAGGAVLEHLGRDLTGSLDAGVADREREVAPGEQPGDGGARHGAVPAQALGLAQRRHRLGVEAGLSRRTVDLVAEHMQLRPGPHAAQRRERRDRLEPAVLGGELAGVDEPQPVVLPPGDGDGPTAGTIGGRTSSEPFASGTTRRSSSATASVWQSRRALRAPSARRVSAGMPRPVIA